MRERSNVSIPRRRVFKIVKSCKSTSQLLVKRPDTQSNYNITLYNIRTISDQLPKARSQEQPHPGQKPQNKPSRGTWVFFCFFNPKPNLRIRVKAQIISKCICSLKRPKFPIRCSRHHVLPLPFQSCAVLLYWMEEAIKPS